MLTRRERGLVQRLRRGRHRTSEGLFLVEGIRAVGEAAQALAASGRTEDWWFGVHSPRLADTAAGRALLDTIRGKVRLEAVGDDELARLSATTTHQGLLGVFRLPDAELADLSPTGESPVLILDGVKDPGNVGTLVRSAVAFGCAGVVCLEGSADPFGPKAVRAAAGMVYRIPLVRATAADVIEWMAHAGVSLWLADASGAAAAAPPSGPWSLALGGEPTGARAPIREAAARLVRVDMPGPAESLNVAVAGSILLHRMVASAGRET